MTKETKERFQVYHIDPENGKVQMSHLGIMLQLGEAGFCRAQIGEDNFILVKKEDKKLKKATDAELISYMRDLLIKDPDKRVVETFVKGVGQYISTKKIHLLPSIQPANDMDDSSSSKFFFGNKIISVGKDSYKEITYKDHDGYLWVDRLLPFHINNKPELEGQFQKFCFNICGKDLSKFERLKSILGYLLHRYKNPAMAKAVIFYDEGMNNSGQAEGGTGKTLITLALKNCRNVVVFNGKEIKENSWFRNQRLEVTTDLIAYDDVKKDFNFASLFPSITTSIEVEKKRQQAFELPFEKSPKILISSNTYVKGPGGNSDIRRRCEFELANYYNEKFTPEDEFGNLFFSQWNNAEWNCFYYFMMDCVQTFLNIGLIEGNEAIESKRRLENTTAPEFVEAVNALCEVGERHNQREFLAMLNTDLPELTSHTFTKWMKIYCDERKLKFHQINTGGNYFFELLAS